MGQMSGQPKFPIFAETETLFFFKVVDATLQFQIDGSGAVTGVRLREGPIDQVLPRKQSASSVTLHARRRSAVKRMTHRSGGVAIVAMFVAAGTVHGQDVDRQAPEADAKVEAPASTNGWFVRVASSWTRVLTPSNFVSGENVARTLTVDIGRQTDGTRDWHRMYNYPSYGVGVFIGRFDQHRELGHPFATYGFFSWPFPVSDRAQVTADFGLGVSWNWAGFDPKTNPMNTALGSAVAYHVDADIALRYLANTRASVYTGVNVAHWSNGGTRQPNLGLAVIGPKIGVRYNFASQVVPSRARPADLPRFEPAWEFVVGAAGGLKNATAATNALIDFADRRRDFGAFNITAGLQRHLYRFGKVAAGTDVTYDGATGARADLLDGERVESRAPSGRRFTVGLYGGYEHVIARFSTFVQLGTTVWRGFEDVEVPRLYQRYGVRFHLSDHVWSTFAVRTTKWRKANFLEFGVGYRVRWR